MSFVDALGGFGDFSFSGIGKQASGGGWKDWFGANDAKRAAEEERKGYEESGEVALEYGEKALGRYDPYARTSQDANRMIGQVLQGDYSGFYQSPDYQFRLEQGNRALDNSASARGGVLSGAQLKAAQGYGQDLASTEYGNWYNRLAGLRGEGIGIAGNQAGLDMGIGDRYRESILGQAGARASGYMADANIKNYLASSLHESGQRIGEAWAAPTSSFGG